MSADRFDLARAQFSSGVDHLQAGRWQAAELAFRASLELLPGRPSALINLGATLLALDRPAEALPLLDQALAQLPHDTEALGHRGLALNRLHRPADACDDFEQLVQLAPQRPEAWFHLAQTRQMLDRLEAAVDAYDRCLALRPQHGASWSQRGTALKDLGRRDAAAASFERALALGDDPELNRYFLAAVRSTAAAPSGAPRAYVERLFDDYAADFDQHLVDRLGYQAPERLLRLVQGQGRGRFDEVLDLGCGTGLCAPLLRPLARRLTGVDLSAGMLEVARRRALYDELVQADLAQHLARTERRHDLLVAADVLIYLGDLAPVFAGARRVLRAGGLFAFSVEPADGDAAFVLQPSLRYAHGEAGLRALAASHGLQVLQAERGALRADQVHEVQGQYWLLAAP
jgi:predicted TPR repeat methyltransferase